MVDVADTRPHTAKVRELVADALRRARRLAFDLRPTILDDIGLAAALARLGDDVAARYGLAVELATDGLERDVRLPCGVQFESLHRSFGPRTSVSANVTVIEPLPCMAPEPEASAISRASSGLADSCC